MDILFLSVSAGGGHAKAAESIMNYVKKKYPDSRSLVVDTVKYISRILNKLVIGSYLNSLKSAPIIFEKIYNMAESGENLQDFSKTLNRLFSIKIGHLVKEFKPDAIICTHPFSLQMLSILKKRGKINVPVIGILTDFTYHPFWMYDYIDAYVVAHEYMKHEMVKKGIDSSIVYPYGLPVSNSFFISNDKTLLLKEFGLEDKLTVMLMGGSLGFGEVSSVYKTLLTNNIDLQVIVLTGRNSKLKKKLEAFTPNTDKKVLILGYTDRVSDLMQISDFLITKPGGMTIAEALIKEIPLIIMSPLPGQEQRNEQFIVNMGAAVTIEDTNNIDIVLYQIIENPIRIRHMKEMAKNLARPDAVKSIVNLVEKLTYKIE